MAMTYDKMRGYRGYLPNAHTCAGAHARELFNGLKITSRNLVTSPPQGSRHVGAGSNMSAEVEKGYGFALVRRGGSECQTGQAGQNRLGTTREGNAVDRDENSHAQSFCWLPVKDDTTLVIRRSNETCKLSL